MPQECRNHKIDDATNDSQMLSIHTIYRVSINRIESVFDCRYRSIDDPHACELFCGYMAAYQYSSKQCAMKRLKYHRLNRAHTLLPMTMVFNNNDDNNKMRAATSRSPLSSIDVYIYIDCHQNDIRTDRMFSQARFDEHRRFQRPCQVAAYTNNNNKTSINFRSSACTSFSQSSAVASSCFIYAERMERNEKKKKKNE